MDFIEYVQEYRLNFEREQRFQERLYGRLCEKGVDAVLKQWPQGESELLWVSIGVCESYGVLSKYFTDEHVYYSRGGLVKPDISLLIERVSDPGLVEEVVSRARVFFIGTSIETNPRSRMARDCDRVLPGVCAYRRDDTLLLNYEFVQKESVENIRAEVRRAARPFMSERIRATVRRVLTWFQ